MNFKETVKVSQLPNGLTVLTDTIPNSKILYASVNIMTGGQHDPKNKLGLAHLSEHLASYGVPGISGDELRDITYDIGLKESNFITSLSETFYYGYGVSDDVNQFIDYVSQAINNWDYSQQDLDVELERIVREMKKAYTSRETIDAFSSFRARFGSGQLAQVSGGVPEHFPNITLQDIRSHHEKSHVGSNMMVITSGEWEHDRVVEWADQNLGHLPKGTPYRVPDSPYCSQDIWIHDGQESGNVDFQITFSTNIYHQENEYGMGLLAMSLKSKIDKLADSLGLYHISVGVVDHPSQHTALQMNFSCEPSKGKSVVSNVLNLLERCSKDPDVDAFEKQKKLMKKATMLHQGTELVTPKQRHSTIKFDFLINKDAYYAMHFEKQIDDADCQQAYATLRHALSQKPGTFYYGDVTSDLPTGEMIQKRDFGQSIKPNAQIVTKFTPV